MLTYTLVGIGMLIILFLAFRKQIKEKVVPSFILFLIGTVIISSTISGFRYKNLDTIITVDEQFNLITLKGARIGSTFVIIDSTYNENGDLLIAQSTCDTIADSSIYFKRKYTYEKVWIKLRYENADEQEYIIGYEDEDEEDGWDIATLKLNSKVHFLIQTDDKNPSITEYEMDYVGDYWTSNMSLPTKHRWWVITIPTNYVVDSTILTKFKNPRDYDFDINPL